MQFPTIITVTTCYWRHDLYRLLPDSWHRTNAGPILRNVNIQTDNKWFPLLTRLLPTTRTQKHQKCGVSVFCICSQYHISNINQISSKQICYAMYIETDRATSIQSMMLNVQKSISSRQTDTKVTKILLHQTRRGGCGWCGDGNVSRLQKLDGIDLIKRNSEWQSH